MKKRVVIARFIARIEDVKVDAEGNLYVKLYFKNKDKCLENAKKLKSVVGWNPLIEVKI